MSIVELSYIALKSNKIGEWRRYADDVLGLMAEQDDAGALRLRVDERSVRVLIEPDSTETLTAIGWLVNNNVVFREYVKRLEQFGVPFEVGSPDVCFSRKVTELVCLQDPMGNQHEIAWGPLVDYRQPFVSRAPGSPFASPHSGLGHVVLNCARERYDAYEKFAEDVLGLRIANFRRHRLEDGAKVTPLTWFHCSNSKHHSFAIAAVENPHPCQHIMIEVSNIDNVGMCHDRCQNHDIVFASTFGRHVNDGVFSFYSVSPSGFWVEYGANARTIGEDGIVALDDGAKGSVWGHKFLIPLGAT